MHPFQNREESTGWRGLGHATTHRPKSQSPLLGPNAPWGWRGSHECHTRRSTSLSGDNDATLPRHVPPAGPLAKAVVAVFADQRRLRDVGMDRDQAIEGVVGEVTALGGGGCADDVHDLGRQVSVRVVAVGGVVLVRAGLAREAVLPLVHVLEDAPSGELVAVHLVRQHPIAITVDGALLPVAAEGKDSRLRCTFVVLNLAEASY